MSPGMLLVVMRKEPLVMFCSRGAAYISPLCSFHSHLRDVVDVSGVSITSWSDLSHGQENVAMLSLMEAALVPDLDARNAAREARRVDCGLQPVNLTRMHMDWS